MRLPKMLLPWGNTTVLGQVIQSIQHAGIQDILVITGAAGEDVKKVATQHGVRATHNDSFESGEMLASIQCGLREQDPQVQGTLVCLGDQPQIEENNVRGVCEAFQKNRSDLVVPSYHMRRGHPWLVARRLWDEILNMRSPGSPRDFLNFHANQIEYVNVDTSSVLEDLDTPEDYVKFKPAV